MYLLVYVYLYFCTYLTALFFINLRVRVLQNSWAAKSGNGFDGDEKLMADEISDTDATDAMIVEDDDSIDAVKKAWNSLKGPWGKRDASDWGSMKG